LFQAYPCLHEHTKGLGCRVSLIANTTSSMALDVLNCRVLQDLIVYMLISIIHSKEVFVFSFNKPLIIGLFIVIPGQIVKLLIFN